MCNEQYINVKLTEINGKHKTEVVGQWNDSHHFMDMLTAIVKHWEKCNHEEQGA